MWRACCFVLLIFTGVRPAASAPLATTITIYDDDLASGWTETWSWDTTLDLDSATTVHAGTSAIAATSNKGWSGLSLRVETPIATSGYTAVAFWIYGNGAPLGLYLQSIDAGPAGPIHLFTPPDGEWSEVEVPLTTLGSPAQIARITWQTQGNNPQPVYYVDDIRLLGAPEEDITLNVDVDAARKPISEYIYGMNEYAMSDAVELMQELNIPVRRWGGNITTRYNYQTDVANHASDWYFGNIKESDATDLPDDSAVNRYIEQNRQAGADSLIVLPLSGFVSNDDGFACGFSVEKYGAQEATAEDDDRPDCGNGIRPNGSFVTGNKPLEETSVAINANFVADWVEYLVEQYGSAENGGIRFYNLDNEPDLWFETHRDIRPTGWTYDQIRDITYEYAPAIKAADPNAAILGPVVHGWPYYWDSPYDGQRDDWASPDDRNAHGGIPFVAWYLQQMRAYEEENGTRILDYLDLHYYPQAHGVSRQLAGDAATQALRLRTTRSLWDPTYVDESWIAEANKDGDRVQLIPRMREWVANNYPGTKLAIGEYNWGGLEHINGALAQADVLGIFGREGLDLATMWEPPLLTQPGAYAFRIYRNYDEQGSKFGNTSVSAISSDQGGLSIYAAQRSSDDALTMVIINKTPGNLDAELTVANFASSNPVQLYRYSAANLKAIVRGADLALDDGQIATSYPANSITLLVIPQDTPQQFDTELRLPLLKRAR
jgi:hypothetical protein